jgi:hypothetical protein
MLKLLQIFVVYVGRFMSGRGIFTGRSENLGGLGGWDVSRETWGGEGFLGVTSFFGFLGAASAHKFAHVGFAV